MTMLAGRGAWNTRHALLLGLVCILVLGPGGCAWSDWHLFKSDPPPGGTADNAHADKPADKSADPPPAQAGKWDWLLHPWKPPPAPPGAAETLVLHGDRLEPEAPPAPGSVAATMAGAHELYRRGDFDTAEKIFKSIANNTKNSPQIAEEARYYEAECLRRQMRYPRAADTYAKLCNDFPSGAYREQAVQRMYDIANFWLDDTRKDMEEYKEKKEGKRWLVWPTVFHWDKDKPLLDEEGRALEKLEQVNYNDIHGPLADKSLFLAGSVKFFREDYREADHYFSQLIERHPNSPFAPQALELGIISKHLSTGGSDYDGRKVAEARQLVDKALRNYPQLAGEKKEFLERQLIGINWQQAEKDFKIADFYRRTGHPGSAYFYYEIVRRRYPGTPFFDKATEKMLEMRAELEKSREKVPPPPPPSKPARQPEAAPPPRPGSPDMAPKARPVTPSDTPLPEPRTLPPTPQPVPMPPPMQPVPQTQPTTPTMPPVQ